MTIFRRAPPGLIASGVLVLGLCFAASAVTYARPVPNEVMFVNVKTGKCVTVAGGVSTDNNVQSVQFDCDSHPARRWMMNEVSSGIYQLRNVRTRKCLTIAGGVSTDNNVLAVQFNCDSHPSRTWRITDVTASGIYQFRNVQTNKCLTIAGGESHTNNVRVLQFDCDADLSRRWTIRLKL